MLIVNNVGMHACSSELRKPLCCNRVVFRPELDCLAVWNLENIDTASSLRQAMGILCEITVRES